MDINSSPPFELLLRVRYSECDAQEVVFNARYADYADLAATEFMRALVGGYQNLVAQGLDNQVVNLNIGWQNSAKFDDILCLSVHVSHVGNTSFSMQITMINWLTKQAIASAEIVYVMLDIASFTKIAISQGMRDKLLKGANGKRINMSGIEISTQ
ncbi:acyl-CoA thioesterase [Brumicola pallidula]|jgi:acyl-CoA thioester hydrolase|uniref:Acyl-CoA thioester hydrolase n=1 Tax=Brumicola pallidula DSM 14239 = ACAM 615 TaxID=1121922 RepID=K6Y3F4_9ALTE|nr:thioesterase family protein [Glaciecola pallidula]GAC27304.1 acyl-CoA thioester hydrolase [Glaciecola pallidula DSM 14239 = ACAM 615]